MNKVLSYLTIGIALLSFSLPMHAQGWGDTNYDGEPWVQNVSRPYKITRGLENRHISLWASHGRYYDLGENQWRWQRPSLFCTTEDLYTQTIVIPYLIPMLENAGAIVFSPRERDWQRNEVIIDNDDHSKLINYIEVGIKQPWSTTDKAGFSIHTGHYIDGENPFKAGTAREAKTTSSKRNFSQISYQPDLPEEGRYAVYISYQTQENSIDDAHYTVWHKGEKTEFYVNQKMGGGTWVYLGTFEFDKGCSQFNRVTLTNQSSHHGVVTADAVRFGGGMGNIERGGKTSGLPRCLEAARYYTQWAGIPFELYSTKMGQDDYKDDINTRPLTTNYLAGGSCYLPTQEGLNVPIELSLAVHSDAGFNPNGKSVYGSLSICTTEKDGSTLYQSGKPRTMAKELAQDLLKNTTADLQHKYGEWSMRSLYDRNYSETRNPEMPGAIFETLSHQSFPDMKYGQDPNFRFTLARSIYKTILKYICKQHDEDYAVTPLAPNNLCIAFTNKRGEAELSWSPVEDPREPSARPANFIVYSSHGYGGYDNGRHVGKASYSIKLRPNVLYSFRVAAVNRGGVSFPSEEVSVLYNPAAEKTMVIVNGFHRLSSPAIIDNDSLQGFNMDEDPGITYGPTFGWLGRQLVFDRSKMGIESSTGLGYSSDELAGKLIAGNDFNYIKAHAKAIQSAGQYNIVSCSAEAVETGLVNLSDYDVTDLILGLERNDGHSLVSYKTFSPSMRYHLERFASDGRALLVSGAYIASDMQAPDEQAFLAKVLKCRLGGTNQSDGDQISGMGTEFQFYRHLNEEHYAATHTDILLPEAPAFPALTYPDGQSACVAYAGSDYRSFVMGFPFECIKSDQQQAAIMKGIINYLLNK